MTVFRFEFVIRCTNRVYRVAEVPLSMSAAHRAAPTVDEKVKNIEANGTRLRATAEVPKLHIMSYDVTSRSEMRNRIRNVAPKTPLDFLVLALRGVTFELKIAGVITGP